MYLVDLDISTPAPGAGALLLGSLEIQHTLAGGHPAVAKKVYAPGKNEIRHPAGAVNVSAGNQQRIRVAADETKIYRLVDGITRKISGVTTGSLVTKDQWLATFSAPGLRVPLQGYLISLDVIDRQKEGGAQAPSQIKAAEESSRQALDRLLNMGISPAHLEEIRHTRETPADLVITAPAAGIVVARTLSIGQRFR